jgi:dTDP-4-amino-4,6-dideoxygalactose transaminase
MSGYSGEHIPLTRPWFPKAMRRAVAVDIDAILESGRLMMGPYKDRLEAAFRDLTGADHAISLNAATTGLQIALRYFECRGREVLVPAASFVTDVSAILIEGATPVLVDIDPDTLALDLDDLERKTSERTAGIVWVHLTGIISRDYVRIADFAKRRDLFLIEDACHAHGAVIDGHSAGSLGDVGVFSFYPTKIMTSGTGGMLVTEDARLARFARELRVFGKDEVSGDIVHLGNDWFLDEMRCCVASHQIDGLSDHLARRRAIATRYQSGLANQPGIKLIDPSEGHDPAWYQYPVFLDDTLDHGAVAAALRGQGIEAKPIYKPVHREAIFRHLDDGTLGNAARMLDRSLCLPMFADLTDQQVDRIVDVLVQAVRA